MNELTINGFSAVSEEEMMMVDGGGIWGGILAAVGAVVGFCAGGVAGIAAGASAGYIIGMGFDGEPIFSV